MEKEFITMNESIINKQYKEIINLLDKRSFREALQAIELLIFDTQDWELRSSFEEIYTSYQYMLQYMRQDLSILTGTSYTINFFLRLIR